MGAFDPEPIPLAEAVPRRQPLVRFGGVCAILGSLVSVVAGIGFGNLTNEATPGAVLETLAARPSSYWPGVQLAFIAGAFLWVIAIIALSWTLSDGTSRALGRLGAASIVLGASVHIVDSSISAYGLGFLAREWGSAGADHATFLTAARALMCILGGTWAAVLIFFHGIPFILSGLAVALSARYPTWWGLVGVLGGLGSVVTGVPMLFGKYLVSLGFYIPFAVLLSLWMIVMGILMWRRSDSDSPSTGSGTSRRD
jgi:uncharacterized protein YggT (Ycf19 family)